VQNCNYHDTAKGLLYLAQSLGVEVWPSIGGWTLSDNFPGIAADPQLREHFAQQCVDLVQAYGFDGESVSLSGSLVLYYVRARRACVPEKTR
jgi:chitinase